MKILGMKPPIAIIVGTLISYASKLIEYLFGYVMHPRISGTLAVIGFVLILYTIAAYIRVRSR